MDGSRVDELNGLFPQAGFDGRPKIAPGTQKPRMSTGVELQVMMPVVNAPFRLYWAYNPLIVQEFLQPPIVADRSMFPEPDDLPELGGLLRAASTPGSSSARPSGSPSAVRSKTGRYVRIKRLYRSVALKKSTFALPALALTTALLAHAQTAASTKVGIIQIQQAILSTKDGQKAVGELRTRFEPKRTELEKKQANIAAMQEQLRKGSATMSEDAKNKLVRDIDQATKSLNRDTEDAQAEVEQAESKIMQELGRPHHGGDRQVRQG